MPRIASDSLTNPRPENKPIYDTLGRTLGTVPNMTLAMGAAPSVLKAWSQFNGALASTSLAADTRERIALLTAERNGCDYCLAAHTALGQAAGLSAHDLERARDARAGDSMNQAALSFAASVLATRGAVDDADIHNARAAGLSDAALAEIVGVVSLNTFTNYFNRAFEPQLDFPAVPARTGA